MTLPGISYNEADPLATAAVDSINTYYNRGTTNSHDHLTEAVYSIKDLDTISCSETGGGCGALYHFSLLLQLWQRVKPLLFP